VRYRRQAAVSDRAAARHGPTWQIDIRRGEILGIVGESGSGKSSIAPRASPGLADYSGTITLSGPAHRLGR